MYIWKLVSSIIYCFIHTVLNITQNYNDAGKSMKYCRCYMLSSLATVVFKLFLERFLSRCKNIHFFVYRRSDHLFFFKYLDPVFQRDSFSDNLKRRNPWKRQIFSAKHVWILQNITRWKSYLEFSSHSFIWHCLGLKYS